MEDYQIIKQLAKQGNKLNLSDRGIDTFMTNANLKLNAYGVEAINDNSQHVNNYWFGCVALYVNMGDTYITTLIYDTRKNKFLAMCWGDFVERNKIN